MHKFEVGFRGTSHPEIIEAEWVEMADNSYYFQKTEGGETATVGLVPIEAALYVKRIDD